MKVNEIPELPDFDELSFDDSKHEYRFDGNVIPSVSEIIGLLSKTKYKSIPDSVLEKAAERGSEVHYAIENWIKFGIEDISAENKPYFDAFQKWFHENKVVVIGSEVKVFHKIMLYGGTVDFICLVNGELYYIDFKTTYQIHDITCGPQTEAYSQALQSHGFPAAKKAILQLKKNGDYRFKEYEAKDIRSWQVFYALKTVYNYLKFYSKG